SDVHDEERTGGGIEVARRPVERQRGLLVARHHLRLDAQDDPHHRPEVVAVLGVAARAGGDHADPLDTELIAGRGVVDERNPGPLDRLRRQPPGAVDALTESYDAVLPMQVSLALRLNIADQQAN